MARRAWTGTLIGAHGAVACACWTIYDLVRGYRISDPDTFSDYNVCQSREYTYPCIRYPSGQSRVPPLKRSDRHCLWVRKVTMCLRRN